MRKKTLSVLLSITMLFSLCSMGYAEENTITADTTAIQQKNISEENIDQQNKDVETMQTPANETETITLMSSDVTSIKGDGTLETPYLICTESDLLALANEKLTNSLTANYKLQNDISVTATTWVPIGNSTAFSGCFDGNGYTVSGVTLEGSGYTYTGFFGKNSGIIKNLVLDATFSASNILGSLAAYNEGTIENCLTKGAVTSTAVSHCGGLVGQNRGIIKASGSQASVSGVQCVGGLVGMSEYGNAVITNCYAQGDVTGSSYIGGLVGRLYSDALIRNCYAAGKVNDGNGAGLVGNNYNSRIYNSYYRSINTGNKTGFSVDTSTMKLQDTFYMWDFDNIWETNGGYPYINVRGEETKIEFDGDGTELNPYIINTEKQLYKLSQSGSLLLSSYFKLVNDIEITAKFWMPIAEYDNYEGVFDGNGHTISGIFNSGTDYSYIGLFGYNKGTIKNLTVTGNVSGSNNIGLLAAHNEGTIENCLTKGSVLGTSSSQCGGLVGNNRGAIKTSCSLAAVSGVQCVGGLVGMSELDNAVITNCYAQGNVIGDTYTGGLVGRLYSGAVIRNCYATGKVNDGNGAGLIGNNYNSRVYNSYYRSINTGNKMGFSVGTSGMKLQDTFYMWDFNNIWEINDGYPYINVRGEEPEIGFDGNGDIETPYYVENENQLYALVMGYAKTGAKIYYQLVNDIEITAKFWMPIGEYDNYEGVFDGNGHTISGIFNSGTDYSYVGLFGYNKGTIKNLTVTGNVSGSNNIGLLAAHNEGTIENCLTKGTVSGTSNSQCGGLVGNNRGAIKSSGSLAAVSGVQCVGGLVGMSELDNAVITNCYAQGNVIGDTYIGGLVGRLYSGAMVRNCYAIGVISGKSYTGGLVGNNYNSRIYNSYYNFINVGNKIGFSTSEDSLKLQDTFYMWDFDNIWEMNGEYPYINLRGEEPEIEFDGDGDIETPYYIENEKQLYALAMGYAKTGAKIYYQLVNDIEITAKFWMPIAEYDSYEGVFDGNGHTISGILNSGTDYLYVGLFGYNKGTIKNLTVTGNVSGSNNIGLLAAHNEGTIENCLTKGSVLGTSSSQCGGLVGNNRGAIKTSCSLAAVSGVQNVGGLVGMSEYGNAVITNCYAHGDVTGDNYIGGLVGRLYSSAAVRNCYASGVVSGKSYTGGLVGNNYNSVIASSYYDSSVSTQVDTTKGTPISTEDMKVVNTYAGWDFDAVWSIAALVNNGYPYLQVFNFAEVVPVTGVTLNKSTTSIVVEKNETLTATVAPLNATNQNVTWTSSDISVATVSNGVVTAKSAGTATITATTVDGGYSAECLVTVAPKPIDENTPKIKISSIKTMPGKEIELTVELENNTGFASMGIEVGYNSDIMTLTKVTPNLGVGGTFTPAQSLTVNPFNFCFDSASNITYNGNIATLTFTMNDSAQDGVYPITLDYYKGVNGNYTDGVNINYDEDFNAVGFVYINGGVTVASHIPGDINGDESVDNKDATYLLRYLAGWTVEGLVEETLDVDGSGEIDNKDATILLRYLAGWSVELH